MAEFIEVMNQKKRMCDRFKNCEKCPIGKLSGELHLSCEYAFYNIPKEVERIVMKWASENPIQTNADKFKEVFGFIPDSEYCPNKCPENGCVNCEYRHFWSQEYKEPKENNKGKDIY